MAHFQFSPHPIYLQTFAKYRIDLFLTVENCLRSSSPPVEAPNLHSLDQLRHPEPTSQSRVTFVSITVGSFSVFYFALCTTNFMIPTRYGITGLVFFFMLFFYLDETDGSTVTFSMGYGRRLQPGSLLIPTIKVSDFKFRNGKWALAVNFNKSRQTAVVKCKFRFPCIV